MDDAVARVVRAIERGDWTVLKQVLHPYLHWNDCGQMIRGRTKVLAHLAEHPRVSPPTAYELRDGQIYRWTVDG